MLRIRNASPKENPNEKCHLRIHFCSCSGRHRIGPRLRHECLRRSGFLKRFRAVQWRPIDLSDPTERRRFQGLGSPRRLCHGGDNSSAPARLSLTDTSSTGGFVSGISGEGLRVLLFLCLFNYTVYVTIL